MKDKKPKKSVFGRIAAIYGMFYTQQQKSYREALRKIKPELDISLFETVIDVGCGTGAFCSVLREAGFDVTGVDSVSNMITIAKRKQTDPSIRLILADALLGLPFPDKSFDIAFACYVAHGLKAEDREILYQEMSRIAKYLVIYHDHNQKRSWLTRTVEWMENGDYFRFIKIAAKEMEQYFKEVWTIEVNPETMWYVCVPKT